MKFPVYVIKRKKMKKKTILQGEHDRKYKWLGDINMANVVLTNFGGLGDPIVLTFGITKLENSATGKNVKCTEMLSE